MTSPTAATSEQLRARFEVFWQRFPYRQVSVDGVEWRYLDTGSDAPAILMLPGGSYRPDNYFQLIDALAGDFRIICPVYPPVYPLRRVLDGVAGVLDDAGLGAVTVFGCSYGGYVAQAMAKAMPERVRELVLAQTGTRHVAGPGTMRLFVPLFAVLPLSMIRAFTWRLWTRWFTAPPESEAFWRARLRTELSEMSRPQHIAGVRNILDFMAACAPAPGWLQPWHGRVLILEATEDQAFSAEQREELRLAYPEATVRSLAAGHTALFTAPDQFTAEIRRFHEDGGAVVSRAWQSAQTGWPGRPASPRLGPVTTTRTASAVRSSVPVLHRMRRFTAEHQRDLTVGGVQWRYARLGSGPAVLWLTGGLRRAGLGFAVLERLAAGHTVLAPDYPAVTRYAEMDAGLSAILDTEGIERCDLVGQSYGGLLAQAFLAAHPQRVRRLVLSGAGPADYNRRWVPVLWSALAVSRVLPRRLLTALLLRGLGGLLPWHGPGAEWATALREVVEHDLTRADVLSHFAVAADVARQRLVHPSRFGAWPGDVVVLRAENDRTRAAKSTPRLQRLLRRPVRTISMGSAGHLAALCEPERYVNWLERALM